MDKLEIKNLLESNELCYLKTLVEQVKENLEGLNDLSRQALNDGSEVDTALVLWELNRLAVRNEDMLNLSGDLIDTAEEKIEKAVSELYKTKEVN